jgi:ribosomal protein L10
MAITRQKKENLIKDYIQNLKDSDNLVVVQQSGITVVDATKIRKSVAEVG